VYDNALVMLHHKLIYADCGAIAVIASMTYMMTIMELIEEYPAPFSPEMMIIIDHDTNIYTE